MSVIKSLANKSDTDLSAYAGYAVKFDTDGINICSAITDQAIGIITRGGATHCDVCIQGDCPALLGAAATAGKHGIPHTDGTVKNTAASSQEFLLFLETGVADDWVNVYVYGAPLTQA
jgi:hypothetical protein